jgi:hypothetical protein
MLIKDPLQNEPSPYEVLDLTPSASAKDINQAMGQAIMAREYDHKTVQNARQMLITPENKALVNLLLYPAGEIATAAGTGTAKSLPLSLEKRSQTAKSWQQALAEDFPNNTLLHALALLWYWWGEYESERHLAIVKRLDQAGVACYRVTRKETLLKKIAEVEGCGFSPGGSCPKTDCPWHQDCAYPSPDLQDIWEKVIAFMTPILSSPKIWPERVRVKEAADEEVRQNLRNRVEGTVSGLSKGFTRASATALANAADQLLLDFETERRTGYLMTKLRITHKKSQKSYSLGTGRFLLRELKELSGTRRAIDKALEKGEGRQAFLNNLRELQYLLSPHANIYHQINRKRWEEALDRIESLSREEQKEPLVRKMAARAHLGMAMQEFEISHIPSALSHWKKAKAIPEGKAYWEEETTAIKQNILSRVAKIEGSRPDEAITLLEGADQLLEKDRDIQTRLAGMLTQVSVHRIVQIQKKTKTQKPTKEDVRKVEEGVQRLTKAAEMGNDRAQDQLKPARMFLIHLVMETKGEVDVDLGGKELPEREDPALQKINRLRREATTDAKNKRWEAAASKLRQALQVLPGGAPAKLKNTLDEECRITENNAIMQWREEAGKAAKGNSWDKAINLLDKALSLIQNSPVGGHADLQKRVKKELSICLTQSAINIVKTSLEALNSGDFKDASLLKSILKSSEKQLVRARKLDPGNAKITQNLGEVRKILVKLGGAPAEDTPRPVVKNAWVVNIALLLGGLALVIFSVPPLLQLLGGLAVILMAAGARLIGMRPGLGLAYTGAFLAAAAYLISLFE